MEQERDRCLHRHCYHRARLGRHSRAQHAACRAGGCGCSTRPSSGRSATGWSIRRGRWSRPMRRACGSGSRAARSRATLRRSRRNAARWSAGSPPRRCRRSWPIRNSWNSPARRDVRPSRRTAHPATAPAAAAAAATPISNRRRMDLGRQARRHRTDDPPRRAQRRCRCAPGRGDACVRSRRPAQAPGHRGRRRLCAAAGGRCASTRRPTSPPARRAFADNCAVCHGDDGKGKRELGAPNLIDPIWLYGGDKAALVESVWNGRGGVMPAWAGRLDDPTIKALAVYVHSLGGGEK